MSIEVLPRINADCADEKRRNAMVVRGKCENACELHDSTLTRLQESVHAGSSPAHAETRT